MLRKRWSERCVTLIRNLLLSIKADSHVTLRVLKRNLGEVFHVISC